MTKETTDLTESSAQAAGQDFPDAQRIAELSAPVVSFASSPRFAGIRHAFSLLKTNPPQVLLLEGGTAAQRLAAAHYWAVSLNCPHDGQQPCLQCAACVRIITHMHRDIFFLDGEAGSIKIAEVRELRAILGDPPREAPHRAVIFHEAQSLVEAAANALLKSLEEPKQATTFLLLAPQRERLLPTLVSRSMVLTLPWPGIAESAQENRQSLDGWESVLCRFLHTGSSLFPRTALKAAVNAQLVQEITTLCRHALIQCLHALQTGEQPACELAILFSRMQPQRLRMIDEALAESQESLVYGVNPVLVLEWLATRLYLLMPR